MKVKISRARQALDLYRRGMKIASIAADLGIEASTVRGYLSCGKRGINRHAYYRVTDDERQNGEHDRRKALAGRVVAGFPTYIDHRGVTLPLVRAMTHGLCVAVLATPLLFSDSVSAQETIRPQTPPGVECGDRDKMVGVLGDRFGESRQSRARTRRGVLVEMFANRDTGSWTLLMTREPGLACIAAHGRAFEADADPSAKSSGFVI